MLTEKQSEILDYIRRFVDAAGYPPTTREIASHFGIRQTAAVGHLKLMENKNVISRQPKIARSIKIL